MEIILIARIEARIACHEDYRLCIILSFRGYDASVLLRKCPLQRRRACFQWAHLRTLSRSHQQGFYFWFISSEGRDKLDQQLYLNESVAEFHYSNSACGLLRPFVGSVGFVPVMTREIRIEAGQTGRAKGSSCKWTWRALLTRLSKTEVPASEMKLNQPFDRFPCRRFAFKISAIHLWRLSVVLRRVGCVVLFVCDFACAGLCRKAEAVRDPPTKPPH